MADSGSEALRSDWLVWGLAASASASSPKDLLTFAHSGPGAHFFLSHCITGLGVRFLVYNRIPGACCVVNTQACRGLHAYDKE